MVTKRVQFQAGNMVYDPITNLVKADRRKGLVVMEHNADGEKIFKWTPEGNADDAIEVYVFGGDAKFQKVNGTKGGRIYYLKFDSYEDKYFFWIQEPDQTKDSNLVTQVNKIINLDEEEIAAQEATAANTTTNTTNAAQANSNALGTGANSSELQALLSSLQAGGAGGLGAGGAGSNIMQNMLSGKRTSPHLMKIFNSDFLKTLIDDEVAFSRLMEHLPDGQMDHEGYVASLNSPQLQQGFAELDKALTSEQFANILLSIGLHDEESMKNASDPIQAFIDAAIKKYKDGNNE